MTVALAVATVVAVQGVLSSYFAGPLDMSAAGGDPRWIVEVTTTSTRSGTMLVYGSKSGLHLYEAPASSSGREIGRAVPFGVAHEELRMMSFGWTPLRVRIVDRTAPGKPVQQQSGRFISAYEPGFGTQLRSGW